MSNSRPSHIAIAKYCRDNYDLMIDLGEPACMACGKFRESSKWEDYERAHIIADMIGGTMEPSNFLLLCKACHALMPNVPDKEYTLKWCRETPNHWATDGKLLMDQLEKEKLPIVLLDKRYLLNAFKKCGTHGAKLTPMTMAWAYRVALEEYQTEQERN